MTVLMGKDQTVPNLHWRKKMAIVIELLRLGSAVFV